MSRLVFVINGPNLDRLGKREPGIYGIKTLDDIKVQLVRLGKGIGLDVDFRQSNHEGDLVDWIHEAGDKGAAVVLNAGAYTHTSVALLDALKSVDVDCIEVHLSNIFKREAFRHHSYISPASIGIISGFGVKSYELALLALSDSTARH